MTRKPRTPSTIPRTPLGQRVQSLRLERGLTQVELSVEAGVTRSHLAKIETGDDPVGRETLYKLAQFFGVTMDYLQTGAHPAASPQNGRFVEDTEQLFILDLWESIPRNERQRIARMLRAAAMDPAKVS